MVGRGVPDGFPEGVTTLNWDEGTYPDADIDCREARLADDTLAEDDHSGCFHCRPWCNVVCPSADSLRWTVIMGLGSWSPLGRENGWLESQEKLEFRRRLVFRAAVFHRVFHFALPSRPSHLLDFQQRGILRKSLKQVLKFYPLRVSAHSVITKSVTGYILKRVYCNVNG